MRMRIVKEHPMARAVAKSEAGFTFAELAFAMIIMVLGSVVLMNHLAISYKSTDSERDRVFAYGRAQAILSEIQSFVDRGQISAAVDLDVLDDGVVTKNPLTIQTDTAGALVPADHVVSGNYQRSGQWVWSRRISVQPFAGLNNRNVRYVTVRIFKRDRSGVERPMADLSAVVNSSGGSYPSSQVFDVYLLAIENIPGWWVFMDAIKPFVESMITDLENRNPGLVFRTHWITKAAFGRNQSYRPYTNETLDSHQVIPSVYHYPGRMPAGNASTYYYVPDNIKARISVEGLERNGYSALNPHPYALADFFNHAMRYPDELALWQSRVAAIELREQQIASAVALGIPPPDEFEDMSKEPTLRLLLEDLNTNPDRYRNALLINLHGELLPMPALRNFSDAARDPVNRPNARVVTHPEQLRAKKNDAGVTEPVRLRVYSYLADPSLVGTQVLADPIVLEVVGVDLTDATSPTRLKAGVTLDNIPGGVLVGGTTLYPATWQTAKHASDALAVNEMYYRAEYVNPGAATGDPFTRIYLFNSPLICPQDVNGRGLASTKRARLYQLDYVPSPVNAGAAFNTTLASIGAGPKNTARWALTLAPSLLTDNTFRQTGGAAYNPTGDVRLQVRTRIASNFVTTGDVTWQESGRVWPTAIQPDNLSTTYAWWTDSFEDVPFTERSQFNGDPRHVPYIDCMNGGDDYPNSYNWYHDNLNNGGEDATTDFPCLNATYLRSRWAGSVSCDAPRYMELLRRGLVRTASVYTTLTGWSYYYLGIGNDIGYDAANNYPNSIPSHLLPHGSSTTGFINTITGARRYVRAAGGNYWWGMPWLGELFPDSAQGVFHAPSGSGVAGNLPAGTVVGSYYQQACQTVYSGSNRTAWGTVINNHHQRLANNGCSMFFNIGTNTSAFRHVSASGSGPLTAVGTEIATNYNMAMPTTAPISRPFGLNQAGAGGDHWTYPPYSTRHTGSLYRTYYTHGSGTGSGLVKLVDPANTIASYVVVNGIDKTVDSGSTFIAKYAVLSLVHSFFEAGSTTNTHRIPQLPRIEIQSPTDITELDDPTTIEVRYGVEWRRWDLQPYAQSGTYAEDELQLQYVIMYSRDNGVTWQHVQDGSTATPGVRPTNAAHLVADAGAGVETYDWSVPSLTFPEGSYLLRIDCYRQGAQVHYAFHQNKIYIQR
jgi:hypothetical protein